MNLEQWAYLAQIIGVGLDEVDRQRVQLRQDGLVPDSQWQELLWSSRNFGARQSSRETWTAYSGAFGKPFQDFISEQMK